MKTMGAAKFKATCLAVMDEVQRKREPVLITKNGKPVAQLNPVEEHPDPIFGFLKGKMTIVGDIVAPLYSDEELAQFERETDAQFR